MGTSFERFVYKGLATVSSYVSTIGILVTIPMSVVAAIVHSYIGASILHHDQMAAIKYASAGAAVISTVCLPILCMFYKDFDSSTVSLATVVYSEIFGQALGMVMMTGTAASRAAFQDAATGAGIMCAFTLVCSINPYKRKHMRELEKETGVQCLV